MSNNHNDNDRNNSTENEKLHSVMNDTGKPDTSGSSDHPDMSPSSDVSAGKTAPVGKSSSRNSERESAPENTAKKSSLNLEREKTSASSSDGDKSDDTSGMPKIPGIRSLGPKKKKVSITTQSKLGNKISRKWLLVGGIALVVVVAAATELAPAPPKPPKPVARVRTISLVPPAVSNASFDKSTEAKLQAIRDKYRRVAHNEKQLAALIHRGNLEQRKMAAIIASQAAELKSQRQRLASRATSVSTPPPSPPSVNSNVPLPPPVAPPPLAVPNAVSPAPVPSNTTTSDNQFGVVLSPNTSANNTRFSGAKMAYSIEKNPYAGYIPAGSFFPAVLLTGIEANTASSAQGNPEPVLMRIQRSAILPNGGKYRLSGCFVLGSATGSISARRADIRLTQLSCINKAHQMVLEAPIKGYAVDSDGKFGLRGTLVEREGSILEKSLLAGFASGLGSAMQGGMGTSYSGSFGTGQYFSGEGSALGSGMLGGVGNAMNQLAQFYLNQAKNIFPVIEVPPGRKITLVLVKGSSYTWHTAGSRYILVKHPVSLVSHHAATSSRGNPHG
ncbi:TraB/VirB10 family protein [Acidithiobacillus sp. M4-SHS-6]|uniref:TraB/VirB10 family protein n=1 Tax=Acidithiobacillus sp. M4-SHS-6 TaxID=3383024 RepID=UPI0039BEC1C8